jgi:hypothetical protein
MTTFPRAILFMVVALIWPAAPPVYAQATFTPGISYFGANGYIEYIAGNLPIIISAAHGGTLQPASIPLRTATACGDDDFSTTRDLNTDALALAIQAAFFGRTGKYPHVIVNRLHRNRLDANRPLDGGACGNAEAMQAWTEFQDYIAIAKAAVTADHGKGWFTDLHGHGHAIQRLELGYNMTGATLRHDESTLNGDPAFEAATSINVFSAESRRSFTDLLRGQTALGTLFANAGYPAVPGLQDPAPAEGQAFFSGGYNTRAHGCMDGGAICGVQIEANLTGVRDTASSRADFAMKLVEVYDEYLSSNFDIYLPDPPPPQLPGHTVIVDNLNAANDPAWARFEASANWSSASNGNAWNPPSFRFAQASGAATNDGAELFFLIARPGTYAVDAWWPAVATRSTGASYRVFEVDGGTLLADLLKNQRVDGTMWNPLGAFDFTKVGWGKVLMSRSLSTVNGSLAADAIRTTLVTAPNRAPYPRLRAPISGVEGSLIAFDGARSFDLDHDPLTHAWDFADGGTAMTATADHAFANDGSFDVKLTVSDSDGGSTTVLRTIAIGNVAPAVAAPATATIIEGERYDASGSFTDPGADSWTATVDYGDGSGAASMTLDGTEFTLGHVYETAGSFTVTVDIYDGDDHGVATTQVTVQTPVQAVEQLAAMVDSLASSGALSAGNAQSLHAKLDTATGPLGAFVNEIEALVRSRRLDDAVGAALVALVQRIARSLTP